MSTEIKEAFNAGRVAGLNEAAALVGAAVAKSAAAADAAAPGGEYESEEMRKVHLRVRDGLGDVLRMVERLANAQANPDDLVEAGE